MTALSRPSIIPAPYAIAEPIQRRWYVLSVEPNRDAQAMRYLRGRRLDARCLRIEVRKSRRDPTKVVQLMFPGYLFIEMADEDPRWHEVIGKEAMEYNHVHCALGSMLNPFPLPEIAIDRLWVMARRDFDDKGYGLVLMDGPDGHEAPSYPEGTPIKVVADGPFIGLFGKFRRRQAHHRVSALLTLFNREIAVELNETDIEPIDEDAA